MTSEQLAELVDCAAGRRPADLVFKNARVVDLFALRVVAGDVAVYAGIICGVGLYQGREEVDLQGGYLLPGLIDAHVHIESSLSTPAQFARLVVPLGTTTVIADPHEIANVCGVAGIEFMIHSAQQAPLGVKIMAPSCVPAAAMEQSGATIGAETIAGLLNGGAVHGLGEVMDFPAVVQGDAQVLAKIAAARAAEVPIDGHAPMLDGLGLNAYVAAGVGTDHECSTPTELRDRVARGQYVLLRHGSAARNLSDLLEGMDALTATRCAFCTDDKEPQDIVDEGHIDACIRLAVERGIDPLMAVRMATLNAAEAHRLRDRGAIAPGRRADVVIVRDLHDFRVEAVYIAGSKVAQNGQALFDVRETVPKPVVDTVHLAAVHQAQLRLHLPQGVARVIRPAAGSLITTETIRRVRIDATGYFASAMEPDSAMVKLAVLERHTGSGDCGVALVENFALRGGAIGGTIAHDSHNVIVIGDNDPDMLCAVEALRAMNGGLVVCRQGRVSAAVALPIAGLMSASPVEETVAAMRRLMAAAVELGLSAADAPFMTLSFLALPVIPQLKLTPRGLFDVAAWRWVDIAADPSLLPPDRQ